MKYIKTFEELDDIAFSVGDIVVCIFDKFAKVGTKFKVERIFYYNNDNIAGYDSQIEMNSLPESQHNNSRFVNLLNLDDYKSYSNIWSDRVVSESRYNEMKYNL